MLSVDELDELMEIIEKKVFYANRSGQLEQLLSAWGISEWLASPSVYQTEREGKIVVVGESEVKEDILKGIIKSLGLNKERFEFCLDYDAAKNYPYQKLQYNTGYRLVLFGPVPHSSTGKNDSSSVIAEMQKKEGYPRVEKLSGNGALKITKTNFRNKLSQLMQEKYL